MIEFNMQQPWSKISDYLNSGAANPLRIAELINRVSPCSWTFNFTFDSTNQAKLDIDCDLTVPDDHTLSLFDGSLEEIFFANSLCFRQGKKQFTANVSRLLEDPPPSNEIAIQVLEEEANFLITIEDFWHTNLTPSEIQKDSIISSYFFQNTWLGSPDFADSKHCIHWIVFGKEYLIQPGNRYKTKLGSTDTFITQEELYNANGDCIGQAYFQTSPSLKEDEIYTTFGPLNPKNQNWLTRKRNDPHWVVEISSETLTQAMIQGAPTTRLINELVDSIEEVQGLVRKSNHFQNYEREIQRKRKVKAANLLNKRQEKVKTREKVIFKDKPLMLVPSNENEVIVLLSKLEALNALPFHEFILWEYTSRTGIDAIASYQIEDVDVSSQLMAVEVEHYFENFFDHGHPHNQVNMVICWDFRDGEAPTELHPQDKWLFEYRNDKSFSVVVLSHIPNLKVKGTDNEQ